VKGVTVVLAVLLGLVHVELWFGRSGVPRVLELTTQLEAQRERNVEARMRNERLSAEVRDLREGQETIEEKARAELGMIRPNEILVQYTVRR
jgi:cell division protein FtsB